MSSDASEYIVMYFICSTRQRYAKYLQVPNIICKILCKCAKKAVKCLLKIKKGYIFVGQNT